MIYHHKTTPIFPEQKECSKKTFYKKYHLFSISENKVTIRTTKFKILTKKNY